MTSAVPDRRNSGEIILVNPRAARWRFRIPLSVLSIGAVLEGRYPYVILDGNIESELDDAVLSRLDAGGVRCVALTVMPGPQLPEAVRLSRAIRRRHPSVTIAWGGYFPTFHPRPVLESGLADVVIRGQGERSFPAIMDALTQNARIDTIPGTGGLVGGVVRLTESEELLDPATLPPLPYHRVNVERYLGRTVLGERTVNYHSSAGCPFLCGFCAVAAVSRGRWKGLPPERVARDVIWFRKTYGVDAVEFHDNNFFVSEQRTAEVADRLAGYGMRWWGEARPDTVLRYDESTLKAMKRGGCAMIFFGAESGSQGVLDSMDKGGTQTPDTVLALADRLRRHRIVPEFSFVLGTPTVDPEATVERDISFIREVKRVNPESEIVLYIYSPVLFQDSGLYGKALTHNFSFPVRLEDWLLPPWVDHDRRRRPVAPWLSPVLRRRIHNFERVLNARFPTVTDLRLRDWQRRVLGLLGSWRYGLGVYRAPYELMALQRLMRYRQPEVEGL